MASANSGASSLSETSFVVAAASSGNAINTSANISKSAPPITSSAAAEHARLFGYRPLSTGNIRSRGTTAKGRARGWSNSSAPYNLHQRGLTWSRSFVCLAHSNQTYPPMSSEWVALALNNLGEKRVEFPRVGNGAQVHEAIVSTFPSLASGYELLQNSEGRGKDPLLLKILKCDNQLHLFRRLEQCSIKQVNSETAVEFLKLCQNFDLPFITPYIFSTFYTFVHILSHFGVRRIFI